MKKAKHWYDYLWICAILYFTLGFFNIHKYIIHIPSK